MSIVYQPSKTTHWKNLFENKTMLLGSHNLNEGEELVGQISSVSIESIKNQNGKDEHVPVIQFNNAPPMVLNITNTKTIAGLYGDLYDHWVGKFIQIYATKVKAFGSVTTALRIRAVVPTDPNELGQYQQQLDSCKDMEQLKQCYMAMPNNIKSALSSYKDQVKQRIGA
jgi:hypothetical protein